MGVDVFLNVSEGWHYCSVTLPDKLAGAIQEVLLDSVFKFAKTVVKDAAWQVKKEPPEKQ
jgi:hypothetical protein